MSERRQIHVEGMVQGVGFRPFIYALAVENGLGGFVSNNSKGVLIELEGEGKALDRFLHDLREQAPPHAFLHKIFCDSIPSQGEESFTIAPSRDEEKRRAFISPDRAICDECHRELFDPSNRRHRYPFINCNQCGPRFTIIRKVPYDREHTTMAEFRTCCECKREYEDPYSRRFHAQANACSCCGPAVRLLMSDCSEMNERDPVSVAVRLLRCGAIIALKGLGGYHLACNALDLSAVATLRERKKREKKPLALMAGDVRTIERYSFVEEADKLLLCSAERPIVLLQKRDPNPIAPEVAPGQRYLGWMLPYTPLHCLLTVGSELPLIMTSGNVSEEPIAFTEPHALQQLRGIADYFLVSDRKIHTRCDDSIVRSFAKQQITIRRSRGYAPRPIAVLHRFAQETLACGAHLKNTVCLGKDHAAFLSQHIGDLENYQTFSSFVETIEQFKSFFDIQPAVIAHDLHPDYASSKYAAGLDGTVKVGVQHHHAHIASCMAENGLDGPVIGIAFDGSGYGADGTLWGGEFMIADLVGYTRRAHLRYVSLAGGESAIRQPWRSALSYVRDATGTNPLALDLPGWRSIESSKVALVERMLDRNVNTFLTSSCGRLFDAAASILGLNHAIAFEGQAAMALEAATREGIEEGYPFQIEAKEPWQIDMRPAIAALIREALAKSETDVMAAKFHNTLVAVITELSLRLRTVEGLNRVCLSGGTFQNMYLLERAVSRLGQCGFEVFINSKVPANDGGISLGQAVVANAVICRGTKPCA